MSSVQALEDRCNFDELNMPGKLQSLEAVIDTAGVKQTLATYEKLESPSGVGNLDINKLSGATNSAFIMTVATDVSISRT
jgi:hypothetical protein